MYSVDATGVTVSGEVCSENGSLFRRKSIWLGLGSPCLMSSGAAGEGGEEGEDEDEDEELRNHQA